MSATGTQTTASNGKLTAADLAAAMFVTDPQNTQGAASAGADWKHGLSVDQLQVEALRRAADYAKLSAADLEQAFIDLRAAGVGKTWIDRTLRQEIKQLKQADSKGDYDPITWKDIVGASAQLGYEFRMNDMTETIELANGARFSDADEATLFSRLHESGMLESKGGVGIGVAQRAILASAGENRYHPIKDYLNELLPDGHDHIARLAEYFTDAHTPITYADGASRTVFHAVLRRWTVGAVAKIHEPDTAQNIMPILDSLQGLGKSTFVRWVCPLRDLHIEKSIDPSNKDFLAHLVESWIWEVPELGALMRKADREVLKGFLTTQHVTYRPPYGKRAVRKPATASFIGTVNFEGQLLSDPTGHRRFFPIRITDINHAYIREMDVNQLWAQAMALYRAGESWRLSPEEEQKHREITAMYETEDMMENHLRRWFLIDPARQVDRWFMPSAEIIAYLQQSTHAGLKDSERSLQMRISTTLNRLGLRKEMRRVVFDSGFWIEPPANTPSHEIKQVRGYWGIRPDDGVDPDQADQTWRGATP